MINAYKEGKDLYSVIASMSFDKPYEDCLEFYPEGTKITADGKEVICGHKTHQNKEGKERRSCAKSILLGVLYGRGAASVGEQIKKSKEEAQEIIDKFFKAFPKVHEWINGSMSNAHTYGYVEDVAGRRRRLPDILLPKYNIRSKTAINGFDYNPLLESKNIINAPESASIQAISEKLKKCRSRKDIDNVKIEAEHQGISISDNTGFIAQAERQAVNSRVQGGAATLTKNALITLYNDQRLRDIGAYLINTVHDEILIEAPIEHSDEAASILCEDMIESAKKYVLNVPMKCDAYQVSCWYLDEFFVLVESEFKALLEKGKSDIEAFEELCAKRTESTRDQIYEIVHGYMKSIPANINNTYN